MQKRRPALTEPPVIGETCYGLDPDQGDAYFEGGKVAVVDSDGTVLLILPDKDGHHCHFRTLTREPPEIRPVIVVAMEGGMIEGVSSNLPEVDGLMVVFTERAKEACGDRKEVQAGPGRIVWSVVTAQFDPDLQMEALAAEKYRER